MTVKIKKSAILGRLNLTPVIDVVFLLLIFFLVAARYEAEGERTLDVVLPQSSEAMPIVAQPAEVFVTIDHDGAYSIGRQPLSADALFARFVQADADNPGRATVIIRADKRCAWEYVVAVMDLCNRAGVTDYRVSADEPENPPAAKP